MSLERLFPRCTPIPVDPSLPVQRYVRNIRQAMRQIKELEDAKKLESAAVLQIRILQLICKALPSHPEFNLPQNKQALKEIRGIAHVAFATMERLSDALNEVLPRGAGTGSAPPPPERPMRRRLLQVAVGLLELFERIAADSSAKQVNAVGILAGRDDERDTQDTGAHNLSKVTALVIPSQTSLPDRADIRYESDVSQLLAVKGLVRLGFIEMCPNQDTNTLHSHSVKMLAELQREKPEAATIVIAPRDATRICSFSLSPYGLTYALACSAKEQLAEDVIPEGWSGEGSATWEVAKHTDVQNGSDPPFKLYDLRPLAVARDEHEKSTKSGPST